MIFENITKLIESFGFIDSVEKILITVSKALVVCAACVIICIVLGIISKIITSRAKTKTLKTITKSAKERHFLSSVSWFAICVTISSFAYAFPRYESKIVKIMSYALIFILMILVNCIINIIGDFYGTKPIAKRRPIKGLLQIVRALIFIVLTIILISLFINQSPLVLIGGIGTFTAIISIVFKDALLGLVAGVQITSDDLVHIGDWVEIPSEKVEGTVQDISLISVKILAFDNTLYTIPAYTFLSVPFRNWYTVLNNKARRAFRTISVDVESVKNIEITDELLKEYSEFEDLEEVLKTKKDSCGKLTNLSVFMEILPRMIKKDPHVLKEKLVICQIDDAPSNFGIPVEFFFFTDLTDWEHFSSISASKEELALNLMRDLGLKQYQSGNALRK